MNPKALSFREQAYEAVPYFTICFWATAKRIGCARTIGKKTDRAPLPTLVVVLL